MTAPLQRRGSVQPVVLTNHVFLERACLIRLPASTGPRTGLQRAGTTNYLCIQSMDRHRFEILMPPSGACRTTAQHVEAVWQRRAGPAGDIARRTCTRMAIFPQSAFAQ